MVRVVEIPPHMSLSIDVVKKLTGGESIPVRTLFKGFFEFQPVCKPHFSTNGQPLIDDASNGIWRRMLTVEWPVVLAEAEQRDFEEVVREFLREGPGILNWLIAGVLDYLRYGFVVSDGVRAGTQSYRDDMDPIAEEARNRSGRRHGCHGVARGRTGRLRGKGSIRRWAHCPHRGQAWCFAVARGTPRPVEKSQRCRQRQCRDFLPHRCCAWRFVS